MPSAKSLIDTVLGKPIVNEVTHPSQSSSLTIGIYDHVLMFGLSLAQRCHLDGHTVYYATNWGPLGASPYAEYLGRGNAFKTLPEGIYRLITDADLDCVAVTGSEHRGHIVNFLIDQNIPVVGPNPQAVQLEFNREYGYQFAKTAGIKTVDQLKFDSINDIRAYIKVHPKRYVLKLDQNLRDACETFVAETDTSEDLIENLNRVQVKLDFADGLAQFYLQDFLPGTEVAVGGFFNGTKIVNDQLFMSYDCTGGFVFDLRVDGKKLIDTEKLTKALASIQYHGPFDINGILDKNGDYYYLEWTPRWGSGMTEFICHSVKDLGQLLYATATGNNIDYIRNDVKNSVVTLVNIREEESSMQTLPILLPEKRSLPYLEGNCSFWCDNAILSGRNKWIVAPIQVDERRKGRYVAHANTFEETFDLIDDFQDDVKISECFVDSARLYRESIDRVETIYNLLKDKR